MKIVENYENYLMSKNLKTEECIILDDNGDIVATASESRYKPNKNGDINLNPLKSKIEGKRILLHTHPIDEDIGTGLSPEDVASLFLFNLEEIRACDKRYWYSARKKKKSAKPPSLDDTKLTVMYDNESKMCRNKFKESLKNRSKEECHFIIQLESWNNILSKLGYTYNAGDRK